MKQGDKRATQVSPRMVSAASKVAGVVEIK